jgi:hypothetical protein
MTRYEVVRSAPYINNRPVSRNIGPETCASPSTRCDELSTVKAFAMLRSVNNRSKGPSTKAGNSGFGFCVSAWL